MGRIPLGELVHDALPDPYSQLGSGIYLILITNPSRRIRLLVLGTPFSRT